MQSKSKLKATLLLLAISHTISFAGPAVVEDRSIRMDSDANNMPKVDNSGSFNRLHNRFNNLPNNSNNNFSNQVATLDESNATYSMPNEQEFKPVDERPTPPSYTDENPARANRPHRIVTYKEQPVQQESFREQPIQNAQVNQPSRQQILKELESMPTNARLNRLENIAETQKNLNLDEKIRLLQEEIQSLRGSLEAERHQFQTALAQQKSLYEDLDRRLAKANNNPSANSNASTATEGSTASLAKQINYTDDKMAQQDLYTMAYTKIKSREYNKAIELFNKYVETYPKGVFAANSNYWLGEIYMIQSEYNKSLDAFDKVLKNYPANSKSADAMYKKGLVHIYLKQFDKAKVLLAEVKTKYKNTTAARLADQQLQGIENINSGV